MPPVLDETAQKFLQTFIQFCMMAISPQFQAALADPKAPGHDDVMEVTEWLKDFVPLMEQQMGLVCHALNVTEFAVNPMELMARLAMMQQG